MKKLLMLTLSLATIVFGVKGQTLTVNNHTSCSIWYVVTASDVGTCANTYSKINTALAGGSSITYDPTTVTWTTASTTPPAMTVDWKEFDFFDQSGTCANGGAPIGAPCSRHTY